MASGSASAKKTVYSLIKGYNFHMTQGFPLFGTKPLI